MKRFWIVIWIGLVVSMASCSGKAESNAINIKDAWARTALQGDNSAIYFTIANPTDIEDVLVSAKTDVAMMTELHMSSMDANGVMQMQPQENVAVPPQSSVEFKPGGLHVMLMNLKKDLKTGDTLQLTLSFKEAGDVVLDVTVQEP